MRGMWGPSTEDLGIGLDILKKEDDPVFLTTSQNTHTYELWVAIILYKQSLL